MWYDILDDTMASARILDLNNHGVLLLKQKKPEAAIAEFKKANRCWAWEAMRLSSSGSSCRFRTWDEESCRISWTDVPDASITKNSVVSPHNMFAVFGCAFTFGRHFDTRVDGAIVSAALHYNLGLAYHLAGLVEIGKSTRHLQEATQYYQMGINSIRLCRPFQGAEQMYYVALAFLNNLGHIYSHFCESEEARECRARLDELLLSGVPSFLSEEDLDFFLAGMPHQLQSYFMIAAPAA